MHLPEFKGRDTVLDRPEGQSPNFGTVRPGVYAFVDPITDQPYSAVWWDPLLLERRGDERRGLRREDLITKEARPELVAEDRARYEQWREWRAAALLQGATPSTRVMTVSEWVEANPTDAFGAVAQTIEIADARAPEPPPVSGKRFGILVHALLAAVPLHGTLEEVAQLARVQARLLGATDDERAAAAAVAERALRHPLLDRARAAEGAGRACRREVALSLVVSSTPGDAVIVDGQADLVWDDGDRWVVVDFKTDVEMAGAEETYRRQVAVYVEAIARATAAAARGVLLRV